MPRILIVEDEQDIRYLYALELKEAGYAVETAADIEEAVAILQRDSIDLVLLDIQLGQENGLDLLQEIISTKDDLPVVLCTAYSSYKEDFSSWLADAYVVKNSDLSEMKETIHQVLVKRNKLS